jgi:HPt (histidine-containing phosphotransfer) domain-containing protein
METKLYNLSYLNLVFQGNKEFINNIINLFLQQVPEYVREMEYCVQRNELILLHPLAQKAKSSISMLGISGLEEDMIKIENDSKRLQNIEGLPTLVNRVKNTVEIISIQLKEELKK